MKCPTVPPLRQSAALAPARPASKEPLTLVPGHWDWANMDYEWIPPAWVPRAKGRLWQDGFWTASGIACYWTPGRQVP